MRKWFALPALLAAGFSFTAVGPATGQPRSLAMLDGLASGRWELRIRGEKNQVEKLCVRSGRALIQIRHPELACDRLVLEDAADSVTVQYTCPGRGYGRTHIRRETAQLVQLESQGVASGLPFDFAAEARRTGDCS